MAPPPQAEGLWWRAWPPAARRWPCHRSQPAPPEGGALPSGSAGGAAGSPAAPQGQAGGRPCCAYGQASCTAGRGGRQLPPWPAAPAAPGQEVAPGLAIAASSHATRRWRGYGWLGLHARGYGTPQVGSRGAGGRAGRPGHRRLSYLGVPWPPHSPPTHAGVLPGGHAWCWPAGWPGHPGPHRRPPGSTSAAGRWAGLRPAAGSAAGTAQGVAAATPCWGASSRSVAWPLLAAASTDSLPPRTAGAYTRRALAVARAPRQRRPQPGRGAASPLPGGGRAGHAMPGTVRQQLRRRVHAPGASRGEGATAAPATAR